MKNLYTKNEFMSLHSGEEVLNEGLMSMFKSLWNSTVKLANKIKGSKEITAVYDKYAKLIDDAFAKMGNIGAASTATAPASAPVTTTAATTLAPVTESAIYEAEVVPPVQNAEKQNNQEQKNLVNLTPEKIAQVAKLTENRIAELKKQFDGEINAIVARLSKNPNYSSGKLTQYSVVMKNQFNSYLYDKWYGFYQKAGDQKKLTELTKVKKENELKYKQSLDALNTQLGEKQQQLQAAKGKKFTYFSKKNNADIEVEVIGNALGQDENGQPNTEKPEYKNMWKVKSDKGVFWISPSSFKKDVTPAPAAAAPAAPVAPAKTKKVKPAATTAPVAPATTTPAAPTATA